MSKDKIGHSCNDCGSLEGEAHRDHCPQHPKFHSELTDHGIAVKEIKPAFTAQDLFNQAMEMFKDGLKPFLSIQEWHTLDLSREILKPFEGGILLERIDCHYLAEGTRNVVFDKQHRQIYMIDIKGVSSGHWIPSDNRAIVFCAATGEYANINLVNGSNPAKQICGLCHKELADG